MFISVVLAINSKFIYIVNSRGILNIYSLSGLLCSSVTCPGRPVSLIAPENDQLFMFTEDSEGILCHRLDAKNGGVIKGSQSSRVILGSDEQLIWLGVSFSGVLGAFSSIRKFSILLTRGTDRWTEILEISATEQDYWPVYFDVNTLSGIKTASGYPDPYPAPIVTDVPFKIPEIASDSVSQSYEE